jgi:hypothetical protein
MSLPAFVQSLGVAYASGINLPATIAVLGIAQRQGWVDGLPPAFQIFSNVWVIGIASALYLVEFTATLIPGVASAWETVQSFIRPVGAALLAALAMVHVSPMLTVLAALLGGSLALTAHGAKLGLRYAVDASPEPVTNGLVNMTELAIVTAVATFIWSHPYITLTLAIILVALMYLLFRSIVRAVRRFVARMHSTPSEG